MSCSLYSHADRHCALNFRYRRFLRLFHKAMRKNDLTICLRKERPGKSSLLIIGMCMVNITALANYTIMLMLNMLWTIS